MIRIIVADDHAIVRAGICRLLELESDIEVAAEAATGRRAVELCQQHKPNVLLLDLDIPDMDGFEVAEHLADKMPLIKIIVLTMHDHEEYVIRLFQTGISGYVVKDSPPEQLPQIIRQVMDGKNYVPPEFMESITSRMLLKGGESDLSRLSRRELQVLGRLARCETIPEIAETLSLSPHTVETYKSRAMNKLGLKNSGEIVRFAIIHGLIKKF